MSDMPSETLKEVIQLHATLLDIKSSLVRHEELHARLRDDVGEIRKLLQDHEIRLRGLEDSSAQAKGAIAVSRTLMAVYSAFASGVTSIIMYLLQHLLGG